MVGTLKRAIKKVVASKIDENWDRCLGQIRGGLQETARHRWRISVRNTI